jgi:hypothetical protein
MLKFVSIQKFCPHLKHAALELNSPPRVQPRMVFGKIVMSVPSLAVSNNQPAELFDAQSRIAHLEAKVEQADYLLAAALKPSVDHEDMLQKMQMAHRTLQEALGQDRELMRIA